MKIQITQAQACAIMDVINSNPSKQLTYLCLHAIPLPCVQSFLDKISYVERFTQCLKTAIQSREEILKSHMEYIDKLWHKDMTNPTPHFEPGKWFVLSRDEKFAQLSNLIYTQLTPKELTIKICDDGWQMAAFLLTWPDAPPVLEQTICTDWGGIGCTSIGTSPSPLAKPDYANPKDKEFYEQLVEQVREENLDLAYYSEHEIARLKKEITKNLEKELSLYAKEIEQDQVLQSTMSELIEQVVAGAIGPQEFENDPSIDVFVGKSNLDV